MQVSIQEAQTKLFQLLELVEGGETVVISRQGHPVAELVPAKRKTGFPFGIARNEPLVADDDEDFWRAMTDDEAQAFFDGK